jgi:UrcA family protein
VRTEVGRTNWGVPVELVSLTREVGYADLDLSTPAGVAALKGRVQDMAKEACSELDHMFPEGTNLPVPGDPDCVRAATSNSLAQVDMIVAAAAAK